MPEAHDEVALALPPLDAQDHLVDVGAGTGKLSGLIARAYPKLGRVTLVEPNRDKLARAQPRLRESLPEAEIHDLAASVSEGATLPRGIATVAVVGSVLMPVMERRGGSLRDGLTWLRASMKELRAILRVDGWLFDLETLAASWARGSEDGPVRRLTMPELVDEFARAGLKNMECVYRFRDRVVVKGQPGPP